MGHSSVVDFLENIWKQPQANRKELLHVLIGLGLTENPAVLVISNHKLQLHNEIYKLQVQNEIDHMWHHGHSPF